MFTLQRRFRWLLLLLLALAIMGCSPKSTPPGASSIGGGVDGGTYSFHFWEQGLAVLMWQNTTAGSGEGCTGSGSTEDPVYRLECSVTTPEGNYSWTIHSTDGLTGEMWIDGQPIDLSKGAMFLVDIGAGGIQYEQLARDLSALERSNAALEALAVEDADVATFLAGSAAASDSPGAEAGEAFGLAELTESLLADGQAVVIGDPIEQPFFTVPGQILLVHGADIQVFEYPDAAAATAEAGQISPNASSVGTSMMSWVATPHFYALDRLIVLYVGDDLAVVDVLDRLLGQPIAEGQGMAAPPLDTAALLSEAFAKADYEALQGLMGETFAIGYWRSEGQSLTTAEAVEQLRLNLLPDPALVSFIRDRSLFPDLGDVDPEAIFGPDVQIVELIYSQGWGSEGLDEAILVISQNPDGSQVWYGLLTGRFDAAAAPSALEPLSSDAAVYHNTELGFAFDYPASWRLDERVLGSRGSGAIFYEPDAGEESNFSAIVYLWDPKNDLDAWVDQRSNAWTGSSATLLLKDEVTVADGQRAIQVGLQWPGGETTNHLFMAVGDRYLELVGTIDLETFAGIIGSLRFVDPGA